MNLVLAMPFVACNFEFAAIPFGWHTVFMMMNGVFMLTVTSVFLLAVTPKHAMFPLHIFVADVLVLFLGNMITSAKLIPVRDRFGDVKKWNIGSWLNLPASMRFDAEKRHQIKQCLTACVGVFVFVWMYPLLNSIFSHVNAIGQAVIVPLFFTIRFLFETYIERVVAPHFSADKMPPLIIFGVFVHEVCLSLMLSSLEHVAVLGVLIGADVLENAYCLWSVMRASNALRKRLSVVSPLPSLTTKKNNQQQRRQATRKRYLTSNTRRVSSTSIGAIAKNIGEETDPRKAKQMVYYIAATLLVREFVEVFVPIQSLVVLHVLHRFGSRHVGEFATQTDEEFAQSVRYVGLDAIVEVTVFVVTVAALWWILPDVKPARIILGVFKEHFVCVLALATLSWLMFFAYVHAYSGMDLSGHFDWLSCEANSTWTNGLSWDVSAESPSS